MTVVVSDPDLGNLGETLQSMADQINADVKNAPIAITANGAVAAHTRASYVITKAGVAALTLAAPTATTDDGLSISLISNTANAHTLTATGLFGAGTASVNLATFAAFAGAGLVLIAYQGKWLVRSSNAITFS